MSIQQLSSGMILGTVYSDGTIEFRDRTHMEVITYDGNLDKVTSLPQIGFGFQQGGPCKDVINSWNVSVVLKENPI